MTYDYETECTLVKGVLRWKSNGRVPPAEHCQAAKDAGLDVSVARCKEDRAAEQTRFLAEYRANPPELTDENLAEARNAFGAGAVVVDVLSGRRMKL